MQPEDHLTLGYIRSHPLEAARRLESMKSEDSAALLAPLPADDVASVLEHCLPGPASRILANLTLRMTCKIITELSTSSAIGVLRQFDESLRLELLERLEEAIGSSLRRAMRYPPHTAANLADPRVLTLPPDITVQEALTRTKQDVRHATYYVYVVDRETKLEGMITLKQLIANDGGSFNRLIDDHKGGKRCLRMPVLMKSFNIHSGNVFIPCLSSIVGERFWEHCGIGRFEALSRTMFKTLILVHSVRRSFNYGKCIHWQASAS